jgi:serine/threonine protein kinase
VEDDVDRMREKKIKSFETSEVSFVKRVSEIKRNITDGFSLLSVMKKGTNKVNVGRFRSNATGETVVLKELHTGDVNRELLEAFIMDCVNYKHERVCSMLDCFVTPSGRTVIVMENYTLTLAELITKNINNRDSIQLADVQRYAMQLLSALVFVHSSNIVHADVRTENVMISSDSSIKLIDFGAAFIAPIPDVVYDPVDYGMVNTPAYKPPEIILGTKFDSGVDVWAAAHVILRMLGDNDPVLTPVSASRNDILEMVNKFAGPFNVDWEDRYLKGLGILKPRSSPMPIGKFFRGVHPSVLNLLRKMLCPVWNERATASVALLDEFFQHKFDQQMIVK